MKKRFICILALLLMLSLTLSACGQKYTDYENGYVADNSATQNEYKTELGMDGSSTAAKTPINSGRKVIITEDYSFETTDLDKCVSDLDGLIAGSDCYLETSNISGNTADGGWLTYTIRVPADKLEGFTKALEGIGNLTSKKRSSDDVTLAYYDNESKLSAYKIHQERLLALLEKAESLEDILKIENELATVRANIENLTTAQNKYDNLVQYSTVNIYVSQVKVYSEPESDSFWKQFADNFTDSFAAAGEFLKGLLFLFIWLLPYILMLCVVVVIILIIVKIAAKKKAKKK